MISCKLWHKKSSNISNNHTTGKCLDLIIDELFSNQLFWGRSEFSKEFLADTLFKSELHEECRIGGKSELEARYYIKFRNTTSGNISFKKIYDSPKYFFYNAEIYANNPGLKIIKNNKEIFIGQAKESFLEAFDIKDAVICDSLRIDDSEGNSGHWIYFKKNMIAKIKLFTVDAD